MDDSSARRAVRARCAASAHAIGRLAAVVRGDALWLTSVRFTPPDLARVFDTSRPAARARAVRYMTLGVSLARVLQPAAPATGTPGAAAAAAAAATAEGAALSAPDGWAPAATLATRLAAVASYASIFSDALDAAEDAHVRSQKHSVMGLLPPLPRLGSTISSALRHRTGTLAPPTAPSQSVPDGLPSSQQVSVKSWKRAESIKDGSAGPGAAESISDIPPLPTPPLQQTSLASASAVATAASAIVDGTTSDGALTVIALGDGDPKGAAVLYHPSVGLALDFTRVFGSLVAVIVQAYGQVAEQTDPAHESDGAVDGGGIGAEDDEGDWDAVPAVVADALLRLETAVQRALAWVNQELDALARQLVNEQLGQMESLLNMLNAAPPVPPVPPLPTSPASPSMPLRRPSAHATPPGMSPTPSSTGGHGAACHSTPALVALPATGGATPRSATLGLPSDVSPLSRTTLLPREPKHASWGEATPRPGPVAMPAQQTST